MATQAQMFDTTDWDQAEARLADIEIYHDRLGCDTDCPCGSSSAPAPRWLAWTEAHQFAKDV